MLIVKMIGGLGNQMYCYALYRTLLERGRDVWMDLSFYDHQNSPVVAVREYEISRVLPSAALATKVTVESLWAVGVK